MDTSRLSSLAPDESAAQVRVVCLIPGCFPLGIHEPKDVFYQLETLDVASPASFDCVGGCIKVASHKVEILVIQGMTMMFGMTGSRRSLKTPGLMKSAGKMLTNVDDSRPGAISAEYEPGGTEEVDIRAELGGELRADIAAFAPGVMRLGVVVGIIRHLASDTGRKKLPRAFQDVSGEVTIRVAGHKLPQQQMDHRAPVFVPAKCINP